MALESFLWEFGDRQHDVLKPRRLRKREDDMTTEAEVDMLRNVQVNFIKVLNFF